MSTAVNHLESCPYLPTACPLGCVCLEGEREGQVARLERIHPRSRERLVSSESCDV